MRFFFHLLRRHLLQHPGRALAAMAALTLAATLMLALSSAGAAVRLRLGPWLDQMFPAERIWLEAARAPLGPIQLEPRPITGATLERLGAKAGVDWVAPIEVLRFPVRIEGELFGEVVTADVVIHGVPRVLIQEEIPPSARWGIPESEDEPWPVMASSYFIDIYNAALARAAGLPLITPQYIIGRHLRIFLGESSFGPRLEQPARYMQARLVGLTSQPALLGLVMPLDVVSSLNRQYLPDSAAHYAQVVVQLEPGADRDAVIAAAGRLGLRQTRQDVLGGRLRLSVRLAGWGLIGLALAVFALGLLNFYQFFALSFHGRRADLVRLRALGMTPAGAAALATAEVAVLAGVALGLAAVIHRALARAVAGQVEPWLERLGTLPPDLFAPPAGWLALTSVVILVLALAPALPMLWWVARVDPGEAIRDD